MKSQLKAVFKFTRKLPEILRAGEEFNIELVEAVTWKMWASNVLSNAIDLAKSFHAEVALIFENNSGREECA